MHDDRASAALLDIDGTLVDSVYLHVDAWSRAFEEVGRDVESWRIHRAIGLDSARLLDELLGEDALELGERAKRRHGELYLETFDRVRVLPGARELVRALADRGTRVVLATSAPADEFEALTGLLDLGGHVFASTHSDDVETAKPEPDVVHVALERAGVAAEDAIMLGDARWDALAAERAGVRTIGLLSGGIPERELRDAGALETYRDAADLLEHLDASLLGAT